MGEHPREKRGKKGVNGDYGKDEYQKGYGYYGKELPVLLRPLHWREYQAFCLATFGLLVAAASGIGGGGFLVPIYVFFLSR